MERSLPWALSAILLLGVGACTTGGGGPDPRVDAGGSGVPILDGCDGSRDTDGDGIADDAEGTFDADGDGIPNHEDLDSDGDGILDAEEHHGHVPCALPDTDGDGTPDWRDTDSDNDGLSDAEERATFSTDPYNRDTDGDGVTDLGEARGTMTDPNDASSTIPPGDFFVVLPYQGAPVNETLRFDTDLQLADVYFLIDTTGSMGEAIANVTSSLSRISTEIRARIPSVSMGVGQFRDFPNQEGITFDGYGSPGDMPYGNEQSITDDLVLVQSALGRLSAGGGADIPESGTEALYQTASGEGGTWTFSSGAPSFDLPRSRCPAIPDETRQRRGYPCFRPESLPIIVMVLDAPFHNGVGGSNAYTGINPSPHSFDQALTALDNLGARIVGVSIGSGPRADLDAVARHTGSVDETGSTLVYDAPSGAVSDAIITGIETLAGRTPQDVDTVRENVPGNPDEFDATLFIEAITPVEGFNGPVSGPMPGITYSSRDQTTFYDVIPGTLVDFEVRFYNDVRMPAETAQIFRATIVVRGNGVTRLDSRNAYIIVPPDGAIILI